MAWWEYIWPFGEKRRARLQKEREIEAAFKKQLALAQERHGDLQDIVEKLKKDQEDRRQTRRRTFPSLPTLTTQETT